VWHSLVNFSFMSFETCIFLDNFHITNPSIGAATAEGQPENRHKTLTDRR